MIKNKAEFDYIDLLQLFGADSLRNVDESVQIRGICVDSREIGGGEAFLALKGEKIDGHAKVAHAFERGASCAFVEKEKFESDDTLPKDKPLVLVNDSEKALGKLGAFHRRRFNIPVFAVAGSNGKTTTKDMIAHVLSQKFNTVKTSENFNNQLGTPLTLLTIEKEREVAVVEIGTNSPGEIAMLSEMVAPTCGIITNIGEEHLEELVDLDGVEVEETFLFGYLYKNGGTAFVNMDDPRLAKYARVARSKVCYGTSEKAAVRAAYNLDKELRPKIDFDCQGENFSVKMRARGIIFAKNAIAAAAAGLHFRIEPERIAAALESYEPDSGKSYGRAVVENLGDVVVLNDCYNANPPSMRLAFETLKSLTAKRKIAVLGDMLELGGKSAESHLEILKIALEVADEVLLKGDEFAKALANVKNNMRARAFDSDEELEAALFGAIKAGDAALAKGSRGMKMERFVLALREKFGR